MSSALIWLYKLIMCSNACQSLISKRANVLKIFRANCIVVEQHEFAESKRDQISGENAGEIDMDAEFHDVLAMPDEELPFR